MGSIYVTSGDAYLEERRLAVTVTDENDVAVDLSGTALRFMVKDYVGQLDADALISKSTADIAEIEIASPQSGATLGVAYLALEEADTEELRGNYYWELEAADAIGPITLASGGFYVTEDLIQGTGS